LYSVSELKDILKDRLSKKRYTHSLNVADEAMNLAEIFGANKSDAYLAGLLHDICKELPMEEQRQMVMKSCRSITNAEKDSPPLYHAIAGAWYIENNLGIRNEDILNAVRYHTIARAGMSRLEQIIYLADLVSVDRTYKEVNKMRRLARSNLDSAMLEAVKFSIADVIGKGALLPEHTIEAYNQYAIKAKEVKKEVN
jgi:nicotinate-nucleotide adenylyltransferase